MKSAGKSDVTEENMEMGFLDFHIKADEKVDEDRNGGAFGSWEKYFRELSETNHKVPIRKFVEYTVHLLSDLLLFFLIWCHICKQFRSAFDSGLRIVYIIYGDILFACELSWELGF